MPKWQTHPRAIRGPAPDQPKRGRGAPRKEPSARVHSESEPFDARRGPAAQAGTASGWLAVALHPSARQPEEGGGRIRRGARTGAGAWRGSGRDEDQAPVPERGSRAKRPGTNAELGNGRAHGRWRGSPCATHASRSHFAETLVLLIRRWSPHASAYLPRKHSLECMHELVVDGSAPRASRSHDHPTPRAVRLQVRSEGAATASQKSCTVVAQACWPVAWQPVPRLRSVRPRITVSFPSHLYSAGAGAGMEMTGVSFRRPQDTISVAACHRTIVVRSTSTSTGHGSGLHSTRARNGTIAGRSEQGSAHCPVPDCQCSLQQRTTRQQQPPSPRALQHCTGKDRKK